MKQRNVNTFLPISQKQHPDIRLIIPLDHVTYLYNVFVLHRSKMLVDYQIYFLSPSSSSLTLAIDVS